MWVFFCVWCFFFFAPASFFCILAPASKQIANLFFFFFAFRGSGFVVSPVISSRRVPAYVCLAVTRRLLASTVPYLTYTLALMMMSLGLIVDRGLGCVSCHYNLV